MTDQPKADWWQNSLRAHVKKGEESRIYGRVTTFLCGQSGIIHAMGRQSQSYPIGSNPSFYPPCRRCLQIAAKRGIDATERDPQFEGW